MPETKIIDTGTTYNVLGTAIEIITQYIESELPNTIYAFFAPEDGNLEGVPYLQGDLVIQMNDKYPSEIDFSLDSNGSLLVIAPDSLQYDFDSDGELTYTD